MAQRSRMKDFAAMRSRRPRAAAPHTAEGGSTSDETPLVQAGPADTAVPIEAPWAEEIDQCKQYFTEIESKVEELKDLHKAALKPTLDTAEEASNEHAIEIQTRDITKLFMKSRDILAGIKAKSKTMNSSQQQRLAHNVVQSLATQMQEMSVEFKAVQSRYLKKMRARDEQRLDTSYVPDDEGEDALDATFNEMQLKQIKDNTDMVREREQAITEIVQSIAELASIFRELSDMIVDQGTILDRIDYNLEHASYHIKEGTAQLVEGEKYQKKATKKMIIIFLVLVVILFIFLFIFHRKTASTA